MLLRLYAALLCVALASVDALGRPCEENDARFVNMKSNYLECLQSAGMIPSVDQGTPWLERIPTEDEMQQMCGRCARILRYWYIQDHPAYEQECLIPNTSLTLSYDMMLATQFYCTFAYRPPSPEEIVNPTPKPKPLEPVDCSERLMYLVFDFPMGGGIYCQEKAQVNLRSHLSQFQLNRMKIIPICQLFLTEGLKLIRGMQCVIPETNVWIDQYFESLSVAMTSSQVPANGKVCTEVDSRLKDLKVELDQCNSMLRSTLLQELRDVPSVGSMDTMCRDHACQLLLRQFVLTPHNYAQECFLPGTSLKFGYDIMLSTHFFCVFGRFANSIEELDDPPKRVPVTEPPLAFTFAPLPGSVDEMDEPPELVVVRDGPPKCNWYLMDMVFGEMTTAVSCEVFSGVKLRQPERIPTAEDLQAMQTVPACHMFLQEAMEIAKGETCLLRKTKISIDALLMAMANMQQISTSLSMDLPKYPPCTDRDSRFNHVLLEECMSDSEILLSELRRIPSDWTKLCDSQACRSQIMAFVTLPGPFPKCYLPGTSLVMEDIMLPIHAHCVGTGSECNEYLTEMMIGSLSFAEFCEHESGVKLTPPQRLPTAYDIAHFRKRSDCTTFADLGISLAKNQTCVFPGTTLSVSAFFEPFNVLEDDKPPFMCDCDGFKLDQVFGTPDRFTCEEAMGFGFNPLLHVPTPEEMKTMCQVPECLAFLTKALPIAQQDQACWIPGTKLELYSDFVERIYGFCQSNEDSNPPLDQPSSLEPCASMTMEAIFATKDAINCEDLLSNRVVMKPPVKILTNYELERLTEVKDCRMMVTTGLQRMINKPDCLVPNARQPLALRGHFLERTQQYCQHRPQKKRWSCAPDLVQELHNRGNMAPCEGELEVVLKVRRTAYSNLIGRYCPNKFCAALATDLREVFFEYDDCALNGIRLSIWRQVLEPCRPVVNRVVTAWFSNVMDEWDDKKFIVIRPRATPRDAAAIEAEKNWDNGHSVNCMLNITASTICQNRRCLSWAKDILNIEPFDRPRMLEIQDQVLEAVILCYYPNDTQLVLRLGSDGKGQTCMTKPDHFPLVNMFSDMETHVPITLQPPEPDPVALDNGPLFKPPMHSVIPRPIQPLGYPEALIVVTDRPAVPPTAPDPDNLVQLSEELSSSTTARVSQPVPAMPDDELPISTSPSGSRPPSAAFVDWSVHRPNLPSEIASALIRDTTGRDGANPFAPTAIASTSRPASSDRPSASTNALATTVVAATIVAAMASPESSSSSTNSVVTEIWSRTLSEALGQPVSVATAREVARAIASTPVRSRVSDTVSNLVNHMREVLERSGIDTTVSSSSSTVIHNMAASIGWMLMDEQATESGSLTVYEQAIAHITNGPTAEEASGSLLVQAIAKELKNSPPAVESGRNCTHAAASPSPIQPPVQPDQVMSAIPVLNLASQASCSMYWGILSGLAWIVVM